MSDRVNLSGTIANWQEQRMALESRMYEIGVGGLLGMDDAQVPPTPPTLTNDNVARVQLETRALAEHMDRDAKGFGYMLGCMDLTTRKMVLDKCGTPAQVADATLPTITIVKGSIRSLWVQYGNIMAQPQNRRAQTRAMASVMTGSDKLRKNTNTNWVHDHSRTVRSFFSSLGLRFVVLIIHLVRTFKRTVRPSSIN